MSNQLSVAGSCSSPTRIHARIGLRSLSFVVALLVGGQQAAASQTPTNAGTSPPTAQPDYATPPPRPAPQAQSAPSQLPPGVTALPPAQSPPQPAVTYPAQQAVPAAPLPRPFRPRGRGLITGGFVMFGIGYLTAAVAGAVIIDTSTVFDRVGPGGLVSYGRRLMIPAIGPYAAAPAASTASGRLFTVLWGTLQLAGLAMAITGLTLYSRDIRHKRKQRTVARVGVGPGQLRLQW